MKLRGYVHHQNISTIIMLCQSERRFVLFYIFFWIQLFEDKEIDGEMLLQADQSVFDELGINALRKTALLNKCKERGLKKSSL